MNNSIFEKSVLSTAEACELLSISAPTLRALCRRKNAPPFIRVGKNYKFPRRELVEWVEHEAREWSRWESGTKN